MFNLPTLLRDSTLSAAALVVIVPVVAQVMGIPGIGLGTMLGVAVGAVTSLLNISTLGWAVAALAPGMPRSEFSRRLLLQQFGAMGVIVALLVARTPPVPFVVGFLCFFPPVTVRAFAGLRAKRTQEIA